jgi:hypothetical protein
LQYADNQNRRVNLSKHPKFIFTTVKNSIKQV